MEMKECENQEGLSNCQKDICFDWKTDLQDAPVPQSHYIEQQPMTYLSGGTPYGFAHTDYMLVQRNPNDYIELENGTEKTVINVHANAWKYTIDRYLNQYIHLRNLQDMYLGKLGYAKISFPNSVMEKYLNNRRASKSRKKELFLELTDFERLDKDGEASKNSYLFPKLGIAACLNLFYQSLGTRPNATAEILTPRHDGICFEMEDVDDFVPVFGIEDYYFHECFTGISLSIEITSILLEVSQKEPDKVLWSNVFDAFCKKALPTIVSSSSLFTRNTVARLFFEQILLELTVNSYQWTDSTKPSWEDKKYWNELVDRASFHLKKLENIPPCYDVEKGQIDSELTYIKALLSEMKFPVDLVSYSNNPTHGLAVFCNEKHKYVADFVKELANLVVGGETRIGNRYEFAKNHPNGLAIMVLMETGISRSELLGLTWDDFDAEKGILHINQGLVSYRDVDEGWVTEADGLKNEYRRRAIPIVEPELLKRLREKPHRIVLTPNRYKPEITEEVDTTFIFHSPQGKPYQPNNWNNRVFLPFMRELERVHPEIPKLSAHELRHTRSSLWVSAIGAYSSAKLLGHCDLKMLLKIYDHTDVDTLKKALEDARTA